MLTYHTKPCKVSYFYVIIQDDSRCHCVRSEGQRQLNGHLEGERERERKAASYLKPAPSLRPWNTQVHWDGQKQRPGPGPWRRRRRRVERRKNSRSCGEEACGCMVQTQPRPGGASQCRTAEPGWGAVVESPAALMGGPEVTNAGPHLNAKRICGLKKDSCHNQAQCLPTAIENNT